MKQTSETTFEPDWLALREPADHAARDTGLLAAAAHLVPAGTSVLDLGSGTGSTARAFAAAGFGHLTWRFFDNDAALLRLAQVRHPQAACVLGDLSRIDDLPLEGVGLITASALLDLMPMAWVDALMARASEAGVPIYAALNYDGTMSWSPPDQRDAVIIDAFNRHQKRDKGFGDALGPRATAVCGSLAPAYGFKMSTAKSPWRLGPDEAALHGALIAGIAGAAAEAGADDATRWNRDRCAAVDVCHAVIGHTDLLAIPV